MFLDDNYEGDANDVELEVYAGQKLTLPTPVIKLHPQDSPIAGATFSYLFANDSYEPDYDGDGNPVVSNELLSVNPTTGVVTTNKGQEGMQYLIAVFAGETAEQYELDPEALHPVYGITVLAPTEATIVASGSSQGQTIEATAGQTLTLIMPELQAGGSTVEGITFNFVLADAEGNPLTDADGNYITENELATVNPATGEVTVKAGATGSIYVAAVLTGDAQYEYAPESNFFYTLTLPTSVTAQILGVSREPAYSMNLGLTRSMAVPAVKLWNGETAVTEPVSFVYEITEGSDVLSMSADHTTFTGNAEGTAKVKVTLAPESAENYVVTDPFFMTVKVANYVNINLVKTAPADFPNKNLVIASATPVNGVGMVAAKNQNPGTGNMHAVKVLPGYTALPETMTLPVDTVNALRQFISGGANFRMLNGAYANRFLKVEKATSIVYNTGSFSFTMNQVEPAGYSPSGNYGLRLGFWNSESGITPTSTGVPSTDETRRYYPGWLSSGTYPGTVTSIDFYSIEKADGQIYVNDATDGSMSINPGETATLAAKLMAEGSNGELVAVSGPSFAYSIVDAEGNPVTDAPFTVAANGTITAATPGEARVKATLTGDYARYFNAEGFYTVIVRTPVQMTVDNEATGKTYDLYAGQSVTLDAPVLRTSADASAIEDAGFTYQFADTDEGVTESSLLSVDPATGVVTTVKGQSGSQKIVAVFNEETAKRYYLADNAARPVYTVNVLAPAEASIVVGDNEQSKTLYAGSDRTVTLPAPSLKSGENTIEGATFTFVLTDAEGNPLTDDEGNPLTENEYATINPATGEVTVKEGVTAPVYVGAVLTGNSAYQYAPTANFVYTIAQPASMQILGVSREPAYTMNLGLTRSIDVPAVKLWNGETAITEPVSFVYEITEGSDVLSLSADNTTFTGEGEGTAKVKVTLAPKSAEAYTVAEPFFMTVKVANYVNINLVKTAPENFGSNTLIIASAQPADFVGLVAAKAENPSTGSMRRVGILAGQTVLPAEMSLPVDTLNKVRQFNIGKNANGIYGYKMLNGSPNSWLRAERYSALTYRGTTYEFSITPREDGGYTTIGTLYNKPIGFWNCEPVNTPANASSGPSADDARRCDRGYFTTGDGSHPVTGVDYYSIIKSDAVIYVNDATDGSMSINPGETATLAAKLMAEGSNGELVAVSGPTYAFSIVDAEGNELTEAPFTVAANGTVTAVSYGKARVRVTLTGDYARYFNAEGYFDVVIPTPATIVVDGSEDGKTIDTKEGQSLTLPAPELKVGENKVEGATFKFVLTDAEGNPLTDGDGNPLTENELVSVNPATGEVTVKEGADGTVYFGAVLTGESATDYTPASNYVYTLNVSSVEPDTYVRITTRPELNLMGMQGVLMLSGRNLGGDLGFAAAGRETTTSGSGIIYSAAPLGLESLPAELKLTPNRASQLMPFDIYLANGVDPKVNQADGYRIMQNTDGQYVYRTAYSGAAVLLTDRAGIDAANSNGGFWYNVSDTNELFRIRTGSNIFLSFNATGNLSHNSGTATADVALYTKLLPAELRADGEVTGSVSIYPSQTATVPVPTLTTTDETGKTFSVPFTYTVVDENGEPFAEGEAPIAVDENGNITVVGSGNARVVVSVAAPFDKFFDTDAYTCDVTVRPAVEATIGGNSGQEGYSLDLSPETTATLPAVKLTAEGEEVENVTYVYEVVDKDGNPFPEGEAPISVDPATGEVTTLRPGEARVKVSLGGESSLAYQSEPFYVDVKVDNFNFVKFIMVDDPSAIKPDQTVIFVGSRTIPGQGFVASSNNIIGTSGNMPPMQILPGQTQLPDEFRMNVAAVDSVKLFHVYTPATTSGTGYGFQMMNTNRTGTNYTGWFIRTDKVGLIRYINSEVKNFNLEEAARGGYAPTLGGQYYLYYDANGTLTTGRSSTGTGYNAANAAANIMFYSLEKTPADVSTKGETSMTLEHGSTAAVPALTLTPEGGHGINDVIYTYEVVDEDGNPLSPDQSPIEVDENGNITVKEGMHGKARVKVTVAGNESLYYDTDPVYIDVTVPAAVQLEFANGTTSDGIVIPEGAEGNSVPEPSLTLDDGTPVTGVTFKYEVVDAEGNPFAEGEAPIEVDENGNITTLKPGDAYVKVSLSDEDAKLYKAEPITYEVKVTSPTEIVGASGEESYELELGPDTETELPAIKVTTVKEGEVVDVDDVTFVYTVVDPNTGEPFPDGEAPVTVDPATGKVTTTDIEGEARIVVSLSEEDAKKYDAEPFHVDVNVKNFVYVHLDMVTDLSQLSATTPVVFVSSRTIAGRGFVASSNMINAGGIETGTTGNMAPISVLPGVTTLPATIAVSYEKADSIRKFNVLAPGADDAGYGFFITDRNAYVKSEKVNRIRYFSAPTMVYTLTGDNNAYTVKSGNFNLGYNSTGLLTNSNSESIYANGAKIVFYSVRRTPAELISQNGDAITVEPGTTGTVKMPTLTATGSNGKPVAIEGAAYKYEVIDPKTGEPFAEGEAPIEVDEEGNITVVGLGDAQVKVTLTGDKSQLFDAEPIVIDVKAQPLAPAQIVFENGTTTDTVKLPEGSTDKVPTPTLTDEEGNTIEGVSFKYQVVDPATGEPFAEGEAPIAVDENGNITTLKKGEAAIKVTLSDEDADDWDVEPAAYNVSVTSTTNITGLNGEDSLTVPVGIGKETTLPEVKLTTVVDGQTVDVTDAKFKYEVINPATGEPFAEGEAPVTVDPENGTVTATGEGEARIKVTLTDETAEEYDDVEPLYIDVKAKSYVYITYKVVNNVDELARLAAAGEGVVVVSARPYDGKGIVAASVNRDGSNNFLPYSLLPGADTLPAEFTLTDEEAEQLLSVYAVQQGNTFGFRLPEGQYLRRKINNQVILHNSYFGYGVTEVPARSASAGFRATSGGNYLGFVANGNLSHQNSNNVFNNGAAPVFFAINKTDATLEPADNASTDLTLDKGTSTPAPTVELKATGSDGSETEIDGVKYKYEVVDKDGNPIPAALAPITVDEDGNITAVKGGEARVKITPTGNAEMLYNTDPVYVDVTVPATENKLVNDTDNQELSVSENTTETFPTPKPSLVDPEGNAITTDKPLTLAYEVVDENGNHFEEGKAPIAVDENGNITVNPGVHGTAYVKVSLTGEDADEYEAEPYLYPVTVKTPAELDTFNGVKDVNVTEGSTTSLPTPVLRADDEEVEGVRYKYEVIDPRTGEPFAEGEAPIEVDEDGNVTALKEGNATVRVSLSDDDAKRFDVEPMELAVNVDTATSIETIEGEADDTAIYININGVKVDRPGPGMYIRIRGNVVDKVIIK